MTHKIFNLSKGEYEPFEYVGCTSRQAVIAAYAQHVPNGAGTFDWNTWNYENRYGNLVIEGKMCIACGDYCTMK